MSLYLGVVFGQQCLSVNLLLADVLKVNCDTDSLYSSPVYLNFVWLIAFACVFIFSGKLAEMAHGNHKTTQRRES